MDVSVKADLRKPESEKPGFRRVEDGSVMGRKR